MNAFARPAPTTMILVAAMTLLALPVAGQLPATFQERIAAVETGLLPQTVVRGHEPAPATIAERMERDHVPGVSIAVIHDGKIDWAKSYGFADVASKRAVALGTLFQAASMSKPVAALAALQLVEEGRVSLDEDVNLRLKSWKVPSNDFTAKKPVTLRGLLTHTAGLTVHGFRGYAEGEAVPTVPQLLDGATPANSAPVRVDIEPGTQWRYSGGGYTVAQQLVADLRGKPFADVMRTRVLEPLGMKESTYEQPLPASMRGHAATGYRGNGDAVAGLFHTYPEMAAAGLWTTPSDYARYVIGIQRALRGEEKVLSKAMTERMLTAGMGDYGLGPGVVGAGDDLRFSHGGANEGFRSYFVAYAHRGEGVVVMTNSDSGSPITQEIATSVARVYGWPGLGIEVLEPFDVPADALDAYTGEYRDGNTGVVVSRRANTLVVSLGGAPALELIPVGRDRFFQLERMWRIGFERDAAGAIVAVSSGGGTRAVRIK